MASRNLLNINWVVSAYNVIMHHNLRIHLYLWWYIRYIREAASVVWQLDTWDSTWARPQHLGITHQPGRLFIKACCQRPVYQYSHYGGRRFFYVILSMPTKSGADIGIMSVRLSVGLYFFWPSCGKKMSESGSKWWFLTIIWSQSNSNLWCTLVGWEFRNE